MEEVSAGSLGTRYDNAVRTAVLARLHIQFSDLREPLTASSTWTINPLDLRYSQPACPVLLARLHGQAAIAPSHAVCGCCVTSDPSARLHPGRLPDPERFASAGSMPLVTFLNTVRALRLLLRDAHEPRPACRGMARPDRAV